MGGLITKQTQNWEATMKENLCTESHLKRRLGGGRRLDVGGGEWGVGMGEVGRGVQGFAPPERNHVTNDTGR